MTLRLVMQDFAIGRASASAMVLFRIISRDEQY
jgi:hypothetical protein